MPSDTTDAAIAVKNVGVGPQIVEGCGVLESGETTDRAADTPHTRALIDAGHLLELEPDSAAARKRSTTTTAKGE